MEKPSYRPCPEIAAENVALHQQVTRLKQTVAELRQSHGELERRLQERTVLWFETNRTLQTEIEQRRHVDASLRKSQSRYRAVVEDQTELICRCLPDGTFLFVNNACMRFLGKQRNELVGTKFQSFMAPEEAAKFEARIAALTVEEPVASSEHAITCADGISYWYQWIDHAFFDEQGHMIEFQSVGHNITAYKRLKEMLEQRVQERTRQLEENQAQLQGLNKQLRSSQSLLLAVFNGMEDGLMIVGRRGQIELVNEPMAALFGCSTHDLLGHDWAALQPRFASNFPTLPQLHEPLPHEMKRINYRRHDGAMRVLDLRALALRNRDYDDMEERVILHVVDVTEQVQLHSRVVENERMAASGRLAASVAHEINTPLQAIQTAFELVRHSSSNEDREMFLDHALDEIQRVGRIVRHLLNLYRPTAHTHRAVDINTLVERVVLLFGKRFADQDVALECEFFPELPTLRGRTDELIQVVVNLVNNALEAMPDGGTLAVQTHLLVGKRRTEQGDDVAQGEQAEPPPEEEEPDESVAPSFLIISVADTGIGIAPDLLGRIFEPFVTTREDGTGLGLAISNDIVSKYGGYITVESEPGTGSTFRVVLPVR